MESLIEQFCGEFSEFAVALDRSTRDLRKAVQAEPATTYFDGGRSFRYLLSEINEKVSSVEQQVEGLATRILDEISLDELVAHCASFYKQNEEGISALEQQLQKYGYEPVHNQRTVDPAMSLLKSPATTTGRVTQENAAAADSTLERASLPNPQLEQITQAGGSARRVRDVVQTSSISSAEDQSGEVLELGTRKWFPQQGAGNSRQPVLDNNAQTITGLTPQAQKISSDYLPLSGPSRSMQSGLQARAAETSPVCMDVLDLGLSAASLAIIAKMESTPAQAKVGLQPILQSPTTMPPPSTGGKHSTPVSSSILRASSYTGSLTDADRQQTTTFSPISRLQLDPGVLDQHQMPASARASAPVAELGNVGAGSSGNAGDGFSGTACRPCARPVSAEEFEAVSRFMRSGVTLQDVNDCLSRINHFLEEQPLGVGDSTGTFTVEDLKQLGYGARAKPYMVLLSKLNRIKAERHGEVVMYRPL